MMVDPAHSLQGLEAHDRTCWAAPFGWLTLCRDCRPLCRGHAAAGRALSGLQQEEAAALAAADVVFKG